MEIEPEWLRVTIRDRYLFISKFNMPMVNKKTKKKRSLKGGQS